MLDHFWSVFLVCLVYHPGLAEIFAPDGVTGSDIVQSSRNMPDMPDKSGRLLEQSCIQLLSSYCLKFSMMSLPETPSGAKISANPGWYMYVYWSSLNRKCTCNLYTNRSLHVNTSNFQSVTSSGLLDLWVMRIADLLCSKKKRCALEDANFFFVSKWLCLSSLNSNCSKILSGWKGLKMSSCLCWL